MIKKYFEYKGQMINYYNKVKTNPNITYVTCYFNNQLGCFEVDYVLPRKENK